MSNIAGHSKRKDKAEPQKKKGVLTIKDSMLLQKICMLQTNYNKLVEINGGELLVQICHERPMG